MPTAFAVFPHGVIGNTTVFGTVILGSSPGGEAFLVFLPAASKAFELGLNDKMCCFPACRGKRHFVLVDCVV